MKNISFLLSENFQFLQVNFSIYLNRRVFVMTVQNSNCFHMQVSRSTDWSRYTLFAHGMNPFLFA